MPAVGLVDMPARVVLVWRLVDENLGLHNWVTLNPKLPVMWKPPEDIVRDLNYVELQREIVPPAADVRITLNPNFLQPRYPYLFPLKRYHWSIKTLLGTPVMPPSSISPSGQYPVHTLR